MFRNRLKKNDADFELKAPPASSLDLGGSKVKMSNKDMGFVADDGKNTHQNGVNKGRSPTPTKQAPAANGASSLDLGGGPVAARATPPKPQFQSRIR